MNFTNQTISARARLPPSAMRRPRVPTVGTRAAGHLSHSDDEFQRIYFGTSSDFGRLKDCTWFRLRSNYFSVSAEVWRVSTTVCGRAIYLDAVMDDFGDLVAINE